VKAVERALEGAVTAKNDENPRKGTKHVQVTGNYAIATWNRRSTDTGKSKIS